jgi:hypothetical protein
MPRKPPDPSPVYAMPIGALTELVDGEPFYEFVEVAWSPLRPGSQPWNQRLTTPIVKMFMHVKEGRPEVFRIEATTAPSEAESSSITSTTLREIPFQKIVDEAIAQVGQMAYLAKGVQNPLGFDESRAAIDAAGGAAVAARRRRGITPAELEAVARVYNEDTTGSPTAQVGEKLGYTYRSAVRYVGIARERGLVEKRGKGRP